MVLCYGIKPQHQLALLFFLTPFCLCACFMFDEEATESKLKLYSHWISSCSFRVRFALNLKGQLTHYYPLTLLLPFFQMSHLPIYFLLFRTTLRLSNSHHIFWARFVCLIVFCSTKIVSWVVLINSVPSLWPSSFTFDLCLEFLKLNPIGFVPVLVDGDSVIADSFAIIMVSEWFLIFFP